MSSKPLIRAAGIAILLVGSCLSLGLASMVGPWSRAFAEAGSKFDNYEIRVIRPRYFTKKSKFELGASLAAVTNQTFIYTYLASGALTYHFTEQLALEASGTYGFSIDKQDKKILDSDDFNIKTQILRTKYLMDAALLYAPIYGKYQLANGRLIYFDTFLTAGAGTTGIEYLYDQCPDPNDAPPGKTFAAPPDPTVVTYPTLLLGAGQRYFVTKRDSLRWEVRYHRFNYNIKDGGCPDDPADRITNQDSVTFQVGMSRFF